MLRRSRAAIVASALAASLLLPGTPAASDVLDSTWSVADEATASLPSEPTNVKAARLPWGPVELSWSWPLDEGNAVRVGFVVHRYVEARQVGLVVSTCSTCGSVDVRLAGVKLGRLYLTSSTTKRKQVLWLPKGVLRSGSLTITSVSTRRVHIDGVLLRH